MVPVLNREVGATPAEIPKAAQSNAMLWMITVPELTLVMVRTLEPVTFPTYVLENDSELGLEVISWLTAGRTATKLTIKPRTAAGTIRYIFHSSDFTVPQNSV